MGTPKAKGHPRVRSTICFLVCLAPLTHAATDMVGYTVGADFWIQLLAVGPVTEHDVPLPGGASVSSIGTLMESAVEQTGSGFADATADTTVEGYHLWGGVLDFTHSSAVANGYVYESGSAAFSVTTEISIEVSNPSEESLAFQFGYDASVHAVFMGG